MFCVFNTEWSRWIRFSVRSLRCTLHTNASLIKMYRFIILDCDETTALSNDTPWCKQHVRSSIYRAVVCFSQNIATYYKIWKAQWLKVCEVLYSCSRPLFHNILFFVCPLCSAWVISPTCLIVPCGNGASAVIICHTCPLKHNNKHWWLFIIIISIKKDLFCIGQYRYPIYNILQC